MNYFSLVTILLFNLIIGSLQDRNCGDWEAFGEEKCFKLLDKPGTQTYEEALALCKKENINSTLASIISAEEQQWITKFVFTTHSAVDNVWIGGKRNTTNQKIFEWEDKRDFTYSNWFDVSLLDKTGNDCIELETAFGFYNYESKAGKWTPVSCKKRNLALCQIYQSWTLPQIQRVLSTFQKEMNDFTKNIESRLIPINFTYVQLPSQPEPKTLWPACNWSDISSQYAGQFFRVLGNSSDTFGVVQEENVPHITTVESQKYGANQIYLSTTIKSNDWSSWVYSGSGDGNDYFLRFKSSGGEVRPRNQAIKVWKRVS